MRDARGYEPGENWDEPMYNVFRKDADGTVRRFWGSELLYVQEEPGHDHRAGDLVDPVWGLLDMSPEGRGDFFPELSYLCYWRGRTAGFQIGSTSFRERVCQDASSA